MLYGFIIKIIDFKNMMNERPRTIMGRMERKGGSEVGGYIPLTYKTKHFYLWKIRIDF